MIRKVLCPRHEERTPSCVIYPSGWAHCFSCGVNFPWEGVLPPGEEIEETPPEDLGASLAYIDSLPRTEVRGLSLPADHRGYYLTWSCGGYYKLRLWEPGKGSKYMGAKGHKRPLFWASRKGSATLALVEGELNALSIAASCPDLDVVSPGGVGDFTEKKIKQQLTEYYRYSTILVVADADKPGAEAIINALAVLWANKIKAVGMPMQPDANEVLVEFGQEELKRQVQERLRIGLA